MSCDTFVRTRRFVYKILVFYFHLLATSTRRKNETRSRGNKIEGKKNASTIEMKVKISPDNRSQAAIGFIGREKREEGAIAVYDALLKTRIRQRNKKNARTRTSIEEFYDVQNRQTMDLEPAKLKINDPALLLILFIPTLILTA